MRGFLDTLQDPDAAITLGMMLSGMARGEGPVRGLAYADEVGARRKAEHERFQTEGLLSEIMSGNTDYVGLARKYSGASGNVLSNITSRMLAEQDRRKAREEGREDTIEAEGLANAEYRKRLQDQEQAKQLAATNEQIASSAIQEALQGRTIPTTIAAPETIPDPSTFGMPGFDFASQPASEVMLRRPATLDQIRANPGMLTLFNNERLDPVGFLSAMKDFETRLAAQETARRLAATEERAAASAAGLGELRDAQAQHLQTKNESLERQLAALANLPDILASMGISVPGPVTEGVGKTLIGEEGKGERLDKTEKGKGERLEEQAADQAAAAQARRRDAAKAALEKIREQAKKQPTPELQEKYIADRATTIANLKAQGAK